MTQTVPVARSAALVLALQAGVAVITIGGAAALASLVPGLPGYSVAGPSQSLVLVVLLAALTLAAVAILRWWREVGFTGPRQWREVRLYWLPIVLLPVPLVAGARLPEASALVVLGIGYLATAVFEETMWRGLMVKLLRPLGVWPAVLGSSVLFGLGHLSNATLRGFSALILLQALGAAAQGVGLAALRLRTNTIWPLIAIHAGHDLVLQLGVLPIAAVEAPIDVLLCGYGVFLLGKGRRQSQDWQA